MLGDDTAIIDDAEIDVDVLEIVYGLDDLAPLPKALLGAYLIG